MTQPRSSASRRGATPRQWDPPTYRSVPRDGARRAAERIARLLLGDTAPRGGWSVPGPPAGRPVGAW